MFSPTCGSLVITFYLEHIETQEITVKLLKIIKHAFSNTHKTQLNDKVLIYLSTDINNFDGIENGRLTRIQHVWQKTYANV